MIACANALKEESVVSSLVTVPHILKPASPFLRDGPLPALPLLQVPSPLLQGFMEITDSAPAGWTAPACVIRFSKPGFKSVPWGVSTPSLQGLHFKHLAPWYTVRGQVQEAAHLEFRGVSPGAQSTEQGVATFQVSTQSLGFPIREMSRELLPFLLHMGALP